MRNKNELKVTFSEFFYLFAFIKIFSSRGFKHWLSLQGSSIESYYTEQNLYNSYIAMFKHFIYDFHIRNPDWKLNEYNALMEREIPEKLLKEYGSIYKCDLENLSSQCLMAILMSEQRADRWHGDINSKWYKDGSTLRILSILKKRCRNEDREYQKVLEWKKLQNKKNCAKK